MDQKTCPRVRWPNDLDSDFQSWSPPQDLNFISINWMAEWLDFFQFFGGDISKKHPPNPNSNESGKVQKRNCRLHELILLISANLLTRKEPNSNVIADVRCDCTRRMCTRRVSRMYPKRVRISLESEAPSKMIEPAIIVPESF